MTHCTQCGHDFDIGRFCTNCGHPVAESAAVASPPTDTDVPGRPRFPLYADEVQTEPAPRDETTPLPAVDPVAPAKPRPGGGRRSPRWWPWLAGLAALLLVAGAGAWLLVGERSPGDGGSATGSTRADGGPASGEGVDLTSRVEVSAPAPAPPNRDTEGNPVSYVADHLVDGVPETCWRVPGDATGESLTFRFEEAVVLTEVGLVNGYAKSAQDAQGELDWYAGNRRVLQVEWTFDDGTLVTQELDETRELQTVSLDHVRTEVVTLRLLEVSAPGTGRASRDYTAISEVALRGTR